ncbi:hypothetical protein BDV38DRAFT_284461 [Aspergillus pseudotamarii]|uniref:Apple domain-containing protein n=1 Tax=Aspergillus pseudotamarii TaxID=132259 RepID=A0A5N6SMR5_ASPPS|nr:uncharacterized protein BDV38DRAFT_284461 [Aspergillus pseudotamarii]KAE8135986.1 hypothetical protein BDV38DRAFT_284461 [Aspergillus pseudotamarii]
MLLLFQILAFLPSALAAQSVLSPGEKCFSATQDRDKSIETCCPSKETSGVGWVGQTKFRYTCGKWANSRVSRKEPAATLQECAALCALDRLCAGSSWKHRSEHCYVLGNEGYTGNFDGSDFVWLDKVDDKIIDDSNGDDSGEHTDEDTEASDNPDPNTVGNEELATKALCPAFDQKEFLLRTPSGDWTRWRVYCDHRATDIKWSERGQMNGTTTPYDTLRAHRYWDAGHRGLTWKDTDFSYRHLTIYNLPTDSQVKTLEGFYLRSAKGSREHVIARVDDVPLRFV